MALSKAILSQALKLSPADKASLVNSLLNSLDQPDSEMDSLWVQEAEERVREFEKGNLKTRSLSEVLGKYK